MPSDRGLLEMICVSEPSVVCPIRRVGPAGLQAEVPQRCDGRAPTLEKIARFFGSRRMLGLRRAWCLLSVVFLGLVSGRAGAAQWVA